MSAIKIVATIGPATNNEAALRELHASGMNIVRLNGSHNTLEWHADVIRLARRVLPQTPILLDIPGRKIRTTDLDPEPVFEAGDTLVLTTEIGHGSDKKYSVNYGMLHEDIEVGATVLADDGTLRFTVTEVRGQEIVCRAEVSGQLKSRKGINVPSVRLRSKELTDRDREMLTFAKDNGVDFIGISFVESANHVALIKDFIGEETPRIVSKIENSGGLKNMDEVIDASDAIMIDRGDLSVETNLESVAIFQKAILKSASAKRKPVIVATEMLHTMIENPFPTKAEVSDISNAVLDGASAIMLSGETAVGAHPIEAVRVMRGTSTAVISHMRESEENNEAQFAQSVPRAIGEATAMICRSLPITKIVAVTISGFAARTVALSHPKQPILAVSNDPISARSFNLLRGTTGVYVDIPFSKVSTDHIPACLKALYEGQFIDNEDLILVTAVAYPQSGNRMNLIQTHNVIDLAEIMGWE